MSNAKTIVVFGAYGRVGSALARRLAQQGTRLVLSGRNPERLQALAADLGAVRST
ncbi:MAG: SDR family NAD(P)-dependent oxidoreductase [Gemmatimonadota bacterium]|nr:SDR family NAD(P)-dependent oxidoreductase [Gemmatimonadota bacterium]MDE3005571.1 SDR family NAD(P)-dependent oxidoreductase [Gemmatimonadota bacterium]MDE3013336.1 SDR family NAD(P)-dependent oxidoreductase [Gemmatimonadota bacterium]